MTLQTCYKRLEIAESRDDEKEIEFWKKRIEHLIPKYKAMGRPIPEQKTEEVEKVGKKSKR